jgi:Reverse transcriptase (RNA-dependent DNA polymerase)
MVMGIIGAFLLGDLDPHHKMYMRVPKGFEIFYPEGVVLHFVKTLYSTKQAAMAFWKKLLSVMFSSNLKRSQADPCLHYKWMDNGLSVWVSWVDDLIGASPKHDVLDTKALIWSQIDCEDAGELAEYLGCKIDCNWKERSMKITQLVLLQNLKDEFILHNNDYDVPAPASNLLTTSNEDDPLLDDASHTKYQNGVGKLMHLVCWSRNEGYNRMRELAKFTICPREQHMSALLRTMKYMVSTPNLGLLLQPKRQWDGKDKQFLFEVTGMADADYVGDKETRISVSGYSTFLEGAPVSTMQAKDAKVCDIVHN